MMPARSTGPSRRSMPARAGLRRGRRQRPDPTDRGRPGVKQHVLVDGHGIPLAGDITRRNAGGPAIVAAGGRCRPADEPTGEPVHRPAAVYGHRRYLEPHREELRARLIDPGWPAGTPNTAVAWGNSAGWWSGSFGGCTASGSSALGPRKRRKCDTLSSLSPCSHRSPIPLTGHFVSAFYHLVCKSRNPQNHGNSISKRTGCSLGVLNDQSISVCIHHTKDSFASQQIYISALNMPRIMVLRKRIPVKLPLTKHRVMLAHILSYTWVLSLPLVI